MGEGAARRESTARPIVACYFDRISERLGSGSAYLMLEVASKTIEFPMPVVVVVVGCKWENQRTTDGGGNGD